MASAPPTQLLKPAQVQALTTLSRATIYRKCRARTFPQPYSLSENRHAWRALDIEAWIANCGPVAEGEAMH